MAVIISSGSSAVSSGTLTNPIVTNTGRVDVLTDGSVSSAVVSSGGQVHVSSGGTETKGTYGPYGSLFVSSAGVCQNLTATGGDVYVFGGSILGGALSSGNMYVSSGGASNGYVSGIKLNSGAWMHISSGGEAYNTVNSSGYVRVYSGGFIESTTLSGGNGILYSGAIASVTAVYNGEQFHVSGGTATTNRVYADCYMTVRGGGSAFSNTVSEGQLDVSSGGLASSSIIRGSGSMCVFSNGTAYVTTISSGGTFTVAGGYAHFTTVNPNALMEVSGGSAEEVNVASDGMLTVFRSGTVSSATVTRGSFVISGGTILNATLERGSATIRGNGKTQGMLAGATLDGQFGINVSSGGAVSNAVISSGAIIVYNSGTADTTTVSSGGSLTVYDGGKLTGQMIFAPGAVVNLEAGSVIDFDLRKTKAGADALINDYLFIGDAPSFTLTVDGTLSNGRYKLADMVETFTKTIAVLDGEGANLGSLTLGQTANIGGVDYTLDLGADDVLSVTVGAVVPTTEPAKFDVDGNGVSDVMFVWTGNDYTHGYWMNGTNEWRSTGSNHPADWDNLGCYDMTGDGKADSVLVGNVVVEGVKGAYIGYYADAIDAIDGSTWVNIDYLNNEANVTWINKVGNLTGGNANSIVWYAPELYTLGAWTDGTSNWVTITGNFGGDAWTLVGCGDFDGDGKASVLMSGVGGAYFYAADLDGTVTSLGAANWSGWTVRAIGDFKGDGRDDLVLFHQETGTMVMLANGNLDDFTSIGQLDAQDWFVVGAGDYNGDAKDDLLVRQYSTGMLGYYSGGDTTQWNVLGYGVDMNWTVIA